MAGVRFYRALGLILLLWAGAARAESPQTPPQLYDRPVLVVDTGTHTADLYDTSADRDGRWAVTGSDDKTVRIWSLANGKLERTIRLPAGPGNVGKVYAVAMSPDGALIAAGGWTRATDADRQEQIYLFDRATGTLVKRIEGLPGDVDSLVFSPDGGRLAAGFARGLRVYAKERGWSEVARDDDYGDQVYGVDFAPDGRLATTSYDGKVRLYAPGAAGAIRPAVTVEAPGGKQPYRIAFSPPDGARLAVGYADAPRVDLLDGHSLATLPGPDTSGDSGFLISVAWSRDGKTLLAGGADLLGPGGPIFAWSLAGAGPRRVLARMDNTAMKLVALPEGDLLVVVSPSLVRLGPDGRRRWPHEPHAADFKGQADRLTVSADGARVGFGYEASGGAPARFDLGSRTLLLGASADVGMAVPRQTGLHIENWYNQYFPTLDGRVLEKIPNEMSRSLAIHPSGKSFVLGMSWQLSAYDANGALLWQRPPPGAVYAVNITGDGRLVVAAYSDGTIRWHRMTDGAELLAFMPLADRMNWVAWTPEGFYAATAGAQGVLRWHKNHGWDEPVETVAVEDIPGSYRPEMLPLVLQELETPRALGLAVLAEHNREVTIRTHSHILPGARLHFDHRHRPLQRGIREEPATALRRP